MATRTILERILLPWRGGTPADDSATLPALFGWLLVSLPGYVVGASLLNSAGIAWPFAPLAWLTSTPESLRLVNMASPPLLGGALLLALWTSAASLVSRVERGPGGLSLVVRLRPANIALFLVAIAICLALLLFLVGENLLPHGS